MSFSLHSHSPEESAASAPEEPTVAAVASQNVGGATAPAKRTERKTGLNRRFTKSFNAVVKDEKKLAAKGMNMAMKKGPQKLFDAKMATVFPHDVYGA